jgi:exonuclease SbcC
MRIHRLSIRAFGPFADTIEVDFERVSESGLFLIRGATGAGKTSLLDAIVFALYADVPGARSKKGLHSDHADRQVVPQVSLDFTAGGRLLRLERSPEFRRPKARGTGETTVPAKAVLFEQRHGEWAALSTRHDEIAEVVQDVVGLGMEQFSKVVLLPQGDFAAFLSATPEQRRTLLEQLFDVSAFTGVEEWLADHRKETALAAERARAALSADLGVLGEILAGSPLTGDGDDDTDTETGTDADWSQVPPAELPARVEDTRARLASAVDGALAELDAARLADAAAATAQAAGTELAARQERLRQARSSLEALDEATDVHLAAVSLLEAASRASAVSGDLAAWGRAATAVAGARERLDTAEHETECLAARGSDATALDEVVAQVGRAGVPLAEASHRVTAAAPRRAQRDELSRLVSRLQAERRTLATAITAAAQDRDAAEAASQRAADAGAAAEARARAIAELTRIRLLRAEQDAESAALGDEQSALLAARDVAQEAREHYQNAVQRRLDGLAGELAAQLHDGDACPVCGSAEHPSPATTADTVTADEVEAAEQTWQTAAAQAASHAERVAAIAASLRARAQSLAGDERTADQLDEELRRARLDHEVVRATAAQSTVLKAAAVQAVERWETLEQRHGTLHDELTTTAATLATVERELEADSEAVESRLAEHRAQCPCVVAADEETTEVLDRAVVHHEAVLRQLEDRVEAARQLTTAQDALDQMRDLLDATLTEHGFAGPQEAREHLLEPERLAELRAQVAAYERRRAAAQAVLDDPQLVAAQDLPEPDLVALAEASHLARATLLAAASAEALARRSLDGLTRVAATIGDRCAAVDQACAAHDVARRLADVVGGVGADNTLRMRLSAFVLAARLEKVATLANERLATMGEGRYQLRHSDGLAARGARSGLGLEVLDLWTGQARSTSSLSGGESFMASLALALGLADAVREEAGGFDLQTLFVDEGFGTLDDDSLEQVMDVLDGLREGGRSVGVVSHVPELRTRIPSQVVVDKTERGSRVRLRVTDESAPAA